MIPDTCSEMISSISVLVRLIVQNVAPAAAMEPTFSKAGAREGIKKKFGGAVLITANGCMPVATGPALVRKESAGGTWLIGVSQKGKAGVVHLSDDALDAAVTDWIPSILGGPGRARVASCLATASARSACFVNLPDLHGIAHKRLKFCRFVFVFLSRTASLL